MQALQRFYASKGWTAAPHLFVAPDGIWLFYPLKDIGIHAGTGNSGYSNSRLWYSIGCELVGDYNHVRPSGAVWENAKAVLGGLSRRLGLPPRRLISFHRDYTNQKSCPGWAITKEWVFGQVDAWLSGQAPPPPPPPGPIGQPAPEVEHLSELLLEQSYARRSEGYNAEWAFHQYAVQQGLGFPIGRNAQLLADGKRYAYQPFAHDTLYNEVPNWGDVRRMSELLAGSIPPAGLGRALLEATYRAGGAVFHANWAFHQYALASQLGPPIGGSAMLVVDGIQYAYQVFAIDTLYNRVPNWSDVHRLSELAGRTAAGLVQLRDALLSATYRAGGATYHPDWAFDQLAWAWNLGAPLSDSYRVASNAAQYAIQVYATDTLYNVVPNWADVRRVTALLAPSGAVLGVLTTELSAPELAAGTQFVPDPAMFHIVQYSPAAAMLTAYSPRYGAKIRLIVLIGDPGPASQSLAAMTTLGARAATHYYVASDATISQIVDDEFAAWHTGMGVWDGRRQNINRISLSVAFERGSAGYAQAQLAALAWLVDTLCARYDLPIAAVVRQSELDKHHGGVLAGFPWAKFVARLARR
jgi:hypothetical protein